MMLRGGGQLAVQKAVDSAREGEFMRQRAEAEQVFEEIEGQKKAASGMETAEESTSVNTDPAKHTPEEQAVIDEYQTQANDELKDIFEGHYKNPKRGFSRRDISPMSVRQAEDASRLLGGNYEGYTNAINSNGVKHILNEHGPDGKTDRSMADLNDAARMGYVLDNYDDVEVVTYESGEIDLSREFRTKENEPAPMLKFSKKVNGTYYVVEAIPESKYKKFWVVSAYMQTADGGTQALDAQGPGNTPNASLASSRSAAETTVPQEKPEVKVADESHTRVFSENMNVRQETPSHPSAAQTPSPQGEGKKTAGVYDRRTDAGAAPLNRVLSDRAVLYLKAVSRATGLRINVVDASENADGWYENGEVFIAENCKDPVNWIATHEVTHHLEQAAPEAYAAYLEKVKAILSQEGDLQKRITAVQEYYAEQGTTLTEDGALRELAANFTERLALDENLFNRIARENRSLAQRLLDSLKEFIRNIRTTWSGQEIRQLEATRKAWEKALRESRGKTVEGGERQYLYAGQNAKTADKADGWFAGADRKQRFEIDDSGMEVKGVFSNFMTLEELIDHPALFEAYPDMRYMEVTFENLGGGLNGQYNRQFDSIAINHNLKNKLSEIRAVLIHEIQHAIQNREGFAKGSTLEAWERRVKNGFDPRREADRRKAREIEEKLAAIKKENPDFYREMMELDAMTPNVPRGEVDWDTLEKLEEDPVEWQRYDARREQLEEKYGDMEVWDFNDLLYERGKAAANQGRTAYELYRDTAGEIEARDAESRRDLTAEQRRSRKPYTGNEDTVFADGAGWMRSDAYNPEKASIKEQIENSKEKLDAMSVVVSVSVPTEFKSKEAAGQWAIKELKRTGYQVDRMNYGVISFNESDIKYGVKYAGTNGERAAFAALPMVLKRGIEVGRHGNHKGRDKATVTFAAP